VACPCLDTSVYTVASDTTSIGRTARKSLGRLLRPPVVSPLGSNVYHGGGIYPTLGGSVPDPEFILLSVFHGSGWCRRPLAEPETWMVFDVPHCAVSAGKRLSPAAQRHIRRHLVGGRCLQHELKTLLQGIGMMGNGGVLFLHPVLLSSLNWHFRWKAPRWLRKGSTTGVSLDSGLCTSRKRSIRVVPWELATIEC
jgi:hypothetical protein